MKILPTFKSHYSLGRSILTLEPQGSSQKDGPDSIIDICHDNGIKTLPLVDDAMTGYLQAYRNCKESKIKLAFGLRMSVCSDLSEKNESQLQKTHKAIIFVKNKKGYAKLIKLSTKASLEGFYYTPRTDYKSIAEVWDDKDLSLCIPFYDSFIYKNLLACSTCVPEFDFTKPTLMVESNGLPFDDMLENRVLEYAEKNSSEVMKSKSIYYKNKEDFKAYLTFRCINNRSTLDKPEIEHMCSDEFSFESWEENQ
jgi:DNA polymerase-3 subunit alpha